MGTPLGPKCMLYSYMDPLHLGAEMLYSIKVVCWLTFTIVPIKMKLEVALASTLLMVKPWQHVSLQNCKAFNQNKWETGQLHNKSGFYSPMLKLGKK